MSMRSLILAAALSSIAAASAVADSPRLGKAITPSELAPYDISVDPAGVGLPPGGATARDGKAIYEAKCQACHGEKGVGSPNDRLAGGVGSLASGQTPVKTVGSYWPYATTLFDYVRRAMPYTAPKSLTDDEAFAATAYVLYLNGIVGESDRLDAATLPKVVMPNRNGFKPYVTGR